MEKWLGASSTSLTSRGFKAHDLIALVLFQGIIDTHSSSQFCFTICTVYLFIYDYVLVNSFSCLQL